MTVLFQVLMQVFSLLTSSFTFSGDFFTLYAKSFNFNAHCLLFYTGSLIFKFKMF